MQHILLSTLSDVKQNHDDFRVIWFGPHEYVPKDLTKLTDYLDICYELEQCQKYVESIKSDRTIFLVFTDFFDRMNDFHKSDQVQWIYALNKNQQHIQYSEVTGSKLVRVFDDEHNLIERLRQDIMLTYRNDLDITISSLGDFNHQLSLTSFLKNQLSFHWNHLFIYSLANTPDSELDQLKEQMIEQCKSEKAGNQVQLKYIDDFAKKCDRDNVLYWYTEHTFVYESMNKAFRTRNIDLICKFQFFIALLYRKLKELSIQQREKRFTTLYRIQEMKQNELNLLRNSEGSLFSTNTIMSTTSNPNVTDMFRDPAAAEVPVVFEIDIGDRKADSLYPFADISHLSAYPEEDEVLIFSGTVFRIGNAQKRDDVWTIKLTWTNETTEQIGQVMNILQKQLVHAMRFAPITQSTNDFSLFNQYHRYLSDGTYSPMDIVKLILYIDGDYLAQNFGDSGKMIEYYEQLLRNKNFADPTKEIVLNILIGKNHFLLEQYEQACFQYRIALHLLDHRHRLVGDVHDHLGDVWRKTCEFDSALLCYKQALYVIRKHSQEDKSIPGICRKIGDIYRNQKNDQDAQFYEEQADVVDEYYYNRSVLEERAVVKHHSEQLGVELDSDVVEYAHTLYTRGMLLVRKGEFKDGLDNLVEAEKFFINYITLYNHLVHKLAKLYEHAAYAYLCLNNRLKALIMWRKSIDIRENFNIP